MATPAVPARDRSRRFVGALALAVALAACGGPDADDGDMRVDETSAMDTTPAGTPAPPSISTISDDVQRQTAVTLAEWSLSAADDALPAGEITFQISNTGSQAHSLAIDGGGITARSDPVPPGGAGSLTVQLDAGTYRLYCPDAAAGEPHATRGMSRPFVAR